jgi:predicted transcriptional regulator
MTVKTDPHDIQEDPMTSASQHAQPSQTGEQTQGLRLRQVAQALDAAVLTGEDHLDIVVQSACCSDLMSDVLAFVHEKAIVLTGLANAHVIRTAEMLDLKCIVFVRGKRPPQDVIDLARELGVVLMSVNKTMFVSAGLLYQAGLRGSPMKWASREGTGQAQ